MQMQDHTYRSEDVVRFLRLLLRKITGKLLVIWDGAPIHRGRMIEAFLAHGAGKRLHLEQLPSYAPELNPDEGIWNLLKRVELKNVCCRDLAHLARELLRAKERLRHRREVIQGCIRQSDMCWNGCGNDRLEQPSLCWALRVREERLRDDLPLR